MRSTDKRKNVHKNVRNTDKRKNAKNADRLKTKNPLHKNVRSTDKNMSSTDTLKHKNMSSTDTLKHKNVRNAGRQQKRERKDGQTKKQKDTIKPKLD